MAWRRKKKPRSDRGEAMSRNRRQKKAKRLKPERPKVRRVRVQPRNAEV